MPSRAFHTGNGEDRPAPRGYQSTDVDNAALLGPFEVLGVNQQHSKLSSVVDVHWTANLWNCDQATQQHALMGDRALP